jgi:hypothetical protein
MSWSSGETLTRRHRRMGRRELARARLREVTSSKESPWRSRLTSRPLSTLTLAALAGLLYGLTGRQERRELRVLAARIATRLLGNYP